MRWRGDVVCLIARFQDCDREGSNAKISSLGPAYVSLAAKSHARLKPKFDSIQAGQIKSMLFRLQEEDLVVSV